MSAASKLLLATSTAVLLSALVACSTSEKPVEKVNGAAISKSQLDRTVKAMLAQNPRGGTLPPEQMQKASAAALEQLTAAELLYQEGAKLAIKDLDRKVAEKFASNKANFPSEAEFQKALASFHITAGEMKEAMRKEIVVNNLIAQRFVPQASVGDAEARAFYDQNREKLFQKGEQVKASHILVSVEEKAGAEEKKKARERAEALLKRVQSGEDFASLASRESNCPSRSRGGELGPFGRGQMTPPFEKAAFALKPGEVSRVVETEFGYHIIKVAQKLPPHTDKFEDVKGEVVEFLKREKVKQALAAYVAQLRSKAKIEKS